MGFEESSGKTEKIEFRAVLGYANILIFTSEYGCVKEKGCDLEATKAKELMLKGEILTYKEARVFMNLINQVFPKKVRFLLVESVKPADWGT